MSNARAIADIVQSGSIVGAGKILQVQYAQKTDTGSVSLTASTATELHTDLQLNITPISTSSLIKIDAQVFGECGSVNNAHNIMFFFYRDTTIIGHPTAGSRNSGIAILPITYHQNASTTPEFGSFTFFDEPNTTSAITYKIGLRAYQNDTFYLNRTVSDTDDIGSERGTSFISATEIAG